MSSEDPKSFLYAWLGKQKKGTPEYDVRPAGGKHRQRFLCQLRVPGYTYTACGNSTSKKDAQTNAAKDFLLFLERQGEIKHEEIPQGIGLETTTAASAAAPAASRPNLGLNQRGGSFAPESLGPAYRAVGRDDARGGDFRRDFIDAAEDRKRMQEAEDVDVNAGMHGNWTMENAKSMLHQWMQTNKVQKKLSLNRFFHILMVFNGFFQVMKLSLSVNVVTNVPQNANDSDVELLLFSWFRLRPTTSTLRSALTTIVRSLPKWVSTSASCSASFTPARPAQTSSRRLRAALSRSCASSSTWASSKRFQAP